MAWETKKGKSIPTFKIGSIKSQPILNILIVGVKVQSHSIQDAWKSRLGQYTLLNPPQFDSWTLKDMELKIEDDFLVEIINS